MSVSLPPPTVPTESDAAEIRPQPPARSLKFEQYTLELHGADVVSDALYDGIVEVSTSLSDVVRRLSAACYAAGYPACQTRYARVDNTVYVLLDTRGVDRVMGAPHIAKYFRGLEGDDSLTVYSLEPRRFLATMHADRAGTVAQPVIKDGDDGDTVMDIASVESEVASKLSAEFGNPGTRFVGRYLGSFNAGIGSVWGDEISLGWREGFTQIGSNANDGDYHELNLAVSRVTPWGIFGGGARKVDYDFSFQGFRIDADIRSTTCAGSIRGWQATVSGSSPRSSLIAMTAPPKPSRAHTASCSTSGTTRLSCACCTAATTPSLVARCKPTPH